MPGKAEESTVQNCHQLSKASAGTDAVTEMPPDQNSD